MIDGIVLDDGADDCDLGEDDSLAGLKEEHGDDTHGRWQGSRARRRHTADWRRQRDHR